MAAVSKRTRIILIVLLLAVAGVGAWNFSISPVTMLFNVPGFSQRWAVALPDRCIQIQRYLDHTPQIMRDRVFSELLPLIALSPEALNTRARSFDIIQRSLSYALNNGAYADSEKITNCLQALSSRMDKQAVQLLSVLLKRYEGIKKLRYVGSGKWYGALTDACRNHDSCAKDVAQKYIASQSPDEREEWLILLGQLNQYGAGEVMPILENLPKLGLSKHDTDQGIDEQADQLAKVVLQKLLINPGEFEKYIADLRRPLAVRWRVAIVKARSQHLDTIPVELVTEAFAVPTLSVAQKFEVLADYPKLVENFPRFQLELAGAAKAILKDSSNPHFDKVQFTKSSIKVFDYLRRNPGENLQGSVEMADYASDLLFLHTGADAESNKQFRLIARTVLSHPSISQPLPAVKALLLKKDTIERGLLLLSIEESTNPWVFQSLAEVMLTTKNGDRAVLVKRLIDNANESELDRKILAGAFPYFVDSERKMLRTVMRRSLDKFVTTLSTLADQPEVGLPTQIALQASMSEFSFKGKKASGYVYELNRKFTCTSDWVTSTQAFTLIGPKASGFETAIFKLLSCPAEMVDYSLLDKALLDKTARRRIQDFLSASRNQPTQSQLFRLTEILSHANRVPGSTLPPKVKTGN